VQRQTIEGERPDRTKFSTHDLLKEDPRVRLGSRGGLLTIGPYFHRSIDAATLNPNGLSAQVVDVMVAFWAAAQIEIHRTKLALHCLTLAGFDVYCPRLRERRISRGRKIEVCPALFPGYLFLQVVNGWWQARWSPGVVRLIMDGGGTPAKVPDSVNRRYSNARGPWRCRATAAAWASAR